MRTTGDQYLDLDPRQGEISATRNHANLTSQIAVIGKNTSMLYPLHAPATHEFRCRRRFGYHSLY